MKILKLKLNFIKMPILKYVFVFSIACKKYQNISHSCTMHYPKKNVIKFLM